MSFKAMAMKFMQSKLINKISSRAVYTCIIKYIYSTQYEPKLIS